MQPNADAEEDSAVELTPRIDAKAPWRICELTVLPGLRLRVRFNDGAEGLVELADFIRSEAAGVFGALRDEALFGQARIVLGAVTWPGELDLAPDAMHAAIKDGGRWVVR